MGGGPTCKSSVTPMPRYSAACSLIRQRRTGNGRLGSFSGFGFMRDSAVSTTQSSSLPELSRAAAGVSHRDVRCVRERRRPPATVDNATINKECRGARTMLTVPTRDSLPARIRADASGHVTGPRGSGCPHCGQQIRLLPLGLPNGASQSRAIRARVSNADTSHLHSRIGANKIHHRPM